MLAKEIWEVIVSNCRGKMGSNTAIMQMERGANDAANELARRFDEDLATAQAQVAMLWYSLKAMLNVVASDEGTSEENWEALLAVAYDALSAAPKVLHSEKAKWDTEWLVWPVVRLQRPPALFCRGPDDVMPGVTFMGHDPERYEEFPGKEAQVIVLDKQGEGE